MSSFKDIQIFDVVKHNTLEFIPGCYSLSSEIADYFVENKWATYLSKEGNNVKLFPDTMSVSTS